MSIGTVWESTVSTDAHVYRLWLFQYNRLTMSGKGILKESIQLSVHLKASGQCVTQLGSGIDLSESVFFLTLLTCIFPWEHPVDGVMISATLYIDLGASCGWCHDFC